ncbi:MAG: fatty acid desaturase family protein, partial [Burkholderiales bacterium]|nr:fatty acid desaturase family protein [Burkholderiales bacterium]
MRPKSGEEFRDDLRRAPARLLPAQTLRELTQLDDWRSAAALLQTLLLTALIISAALWWWHPLTILAAIVLIGTQQHAMFVLAHESAHYRLFSNRVLNDAVGRALGSISGISMCSYRVVHRLHHNDLYGSQDPDIALHGGYPRGKGYLLRKLAGDITGLNAWKTFLYFFGNPAINADTGTALRPLDDTAPALRAAARRDRWGMVAVQVLMPALIFALGGWQALLAYLLLWIVPLLTVVQVILRVRALLEHGAIGDRSSPLTAARTNLARPLARLFLFPHHVNYHIEHHLFPAVPHYHLPRLHDILGRAGVLDGAEVRQPQQPR